MSKQDIIDKIKKVKRLAEKGVDGEKESAQKRVEEMMQRYGITEDDLDDEKESLFTYYVEGLYGWKLLNQIIGKHFPDIHAMYMPHHRIPKDHRMLFKEIAKGKKHNVICCCNAAQFVEVTTYYEIMHRSFQEQAEIFYYAFLSKNNLLVEGDGHEPSEKELKEARQAAIMGMGIEKAEVHKALEGKEVEI